MKEVFKESNKVKYQFRSYYCQGCNQKKPCGLLSGERCCQCFHKSEQVRTQEYNSYEKVLGDKQKSQEVRIKQLKFLREYAGCSRCGSKEVDAYELYENNRLVCQPCLVKKIGQSSSPISFARESKWYQKRWRINLEEWLNTYDCLPINANCAREWLKNKEHLKNCVCLEQETKELCELFTNSLKKAEEKLKKCFCKKSKKVRVDSDYYAWCESCEKSIVVASKKRVIKNRNDPRFWGLEVKEKVLCGECLEVRKGEMKSLRRAEFNRYRRLGRV